ncbi:cytochrome D1 domain-containing protein [Caballeronia sp. LZ062]|uniref:YVTN family beta-propeller repeat protein n=1 Tax=unclassified Caballeronia TaxID=2646786 RepID=UPI0028672D15|nr:MULTISPECIES: cytochrome D1 domain-containing protein [unclassified Caballeronia]MDR5855746.1 cytochrome D1 domain-containing protein [Caballeronia sp. LZ050]MDR5872467.1 cytochrome D1 domain-containing protein [Caballeronia sp. LZ062]
MSVTRPLRHKALQHLGIAVIALAQATAHAEDVIVLNSADASISLIDQASQKVVDTYPVGKEPHHLMATPDNRSLIVANSVANNLVLLDPENGKVQRWIPNIEDPYQLGFSNDRKWFVTNGLRLDRIDIYRYDGKDFSLAKRVPLAKMPSHMIFTADSKIVFVTLQESGEVAAIDLARQTVLWKMPVGKAPAGLWLTPGDKYLLVGMTGADYVAVVDWRAQKVVKTIHTDNGAHNFRSLSDGHHVLVSNRVGNTISILDQDNLTTVGTITGLLPGPDDMELSQDKRYLWVTFRFTRYVGVIDMKTLKLVNTIKVGKSPHGIYFHNRAPLS